MKKVVASLSTIIMVITAIPEKGSATPLEPIVVPMVSEVVKNTVNDLFRKQSTNQATTTQEIADSTNSYPSSEQANPNQSYYQQNPQQQPYPNQSYYQQYPPQQPYPNQSYYQQYPPQQPYPNQPSYQQYPAPIYIMPMYPPQRPTTPVIINNF